jgi:hypothetical protein
MYLSLFVMCDVALVSNTHCSLQCPIHFGGGMVITIATVCDSDSLRHFMPSGSGNFILVSTLSSNIFSFSVKYHGGTVYTYCNVRKYVSVVVPCNSMMSSDLAMVSNGGPSSCGISFPCTVLRILDP